MPLTIRPVSTEDRAALGRLAGELVRLFHRMDPDRFIPGEGVDEGYGAWLLKEASAELGRVFVAIDGGNLIGYVFVRREPRNWMELLDEHGKVHDLMVREGTRRRGVGRLLMEHAMGALREMGCERIVLSTAAVNETAQKFFASLGFRPTMVEMTLTDSTQRAAQ